MTSGVGALAAVNEGHRALGIGLSVRSRGHVLLSIGLTL